MINKRHVLVQSLMVFARHCILLCAIDSAGLICIIGTSFLIISITLYPQSGLMEKLYTRDTYFVSAGCVYLTNNLEQRSAKWRLHC